MPNKQITCHHNLIHAINSFTEITQSEYALLYIIAIYTGIPLKDFLSVNRIMVSQAKRESKGEQILITPTIYDTYTHCISYDNFPSQKTLQTPTHALCSHQHNFEHPGTDHGQFVLLSKDR